MAWIGRGRTSGDALVKSRNCVLPSIACCWPWFLIMHICEVFPVKLFSRRYEGTNGYSAILPSSNVSDIVWARLSSIYQDLLLKV